MSTAQTTLRYLLDTNICIYLINRRPAFGAEKSAHAERNHARLRDLTQRLPLVGIDANTSGHYARIRARLERQGTLIGANDLWIAAQALNLEAILVTDNQREFQRVPGLALRNWLSER